MKKGGIIVFCLLLSSFFLSGCSFQSKQAALQINTNSPADVFVNGVSLGKTPYSSNELQAGEVTVRLVPESNTEGYTAWEGKIKLVGGILVLIDQQFGSSSVSSSGQVLTLEKIKDKQNAIISVVSEPDGVLVKLDGETKGFSPINIDSGAAGDHEIILSKEGYLDKTIRARSVLSYRLVINAKLGQTQVSSQDSLSSTPTPSGSAGTETAALEKPYVIISETETGFLRVRNAPSGDELTKVNPGESFAFIEESTDWYKIEYEKGKEGWISSQYAKKVE